MSDRPFFDVSNEAEAAAALDYFNGSHDGFITRLVLVSQDAVEEDRSRTCNCDLSRHRDRRVLPPPWIKHF